MTEQDDAAQTGVAPTELGSVIDETEAVTAWSLDDDEDPTPAPWWTARRITTAAVAGCALVSAVCAAVVLIHLSGQASPPPASVAAPTAAEPTSAPSTDPSPTTKPTFTARPAEAETMRPPPPPPETVVVQAPRVAWTPAHDRQFIATLVAYGWSVWDPAGTVLQARDVCTVLQQGATPQSIINELTSPGSPTTVTEAEVFVRTAMQIYPGCP